MFDEILFIYLFGTFMLTLFLVPSILLILVTRSRSLSIGTCPSLDINNWPNQEDFFGRNSEGSDFQENILLSLFDVFVQLS